MADPTDPLDGAADQLYALPPEEFTAARNIRATDAKGDLAKRIKALRKPAVAAWAVNLLVRDGQLAQAVELSAALREAQDDLDAKELTQLGRQRRQLVASLTRRAGELVRDNGGTFGPAVQEAVSNTINAAVMDEAAAAAVLTGRLIKPLEAGDLDNIDVTEVVAGSIPAQETRPAPPRNDLAERRARKAAEAAAQAAERTASEAERELARIEARRTKAHERAELLQERIEELRAELDRVTADAEAADADAQRLDAEREAAASRAKTAAHDAERARAAVPSAQRAD
jgi:hypothetical protein